MKKNTKKLTMNFPVGDFLTRVKNAAMAGNKKVRMPYTKQVVAIAATLKKSGFLDEVKNENGTIEVSMTFKDKRPLLMDIKLISKPGRRIYMEVSEIGNKRGPSSYLISTPKGVLMSKDAIKQNMGGEIIAEIW